MQTNIEKAINLVIKKEPKEFQQTIEQLRLSPKRPNSVNKQAQAKALIKRLVNNACKRHKHSTQKINIGLKQSNKNIAIKRNWATEISKSKAFHNSIRQIKLTKNIQTPYLNTIIKDGSGY